MAQFHPPTNSTQRGTARQVGAAGIEPNTIGYLLDLFNFYFYRMESVYPKWLHAADMLEKHGPTYLALLDRLPPAERQAVLDLSHLDLMSDIRSRAGNLQFIHNLRPQDKSRIQVALKSNPESLPAVAAYMIFLHAYSVEGEWREAQGILTGRYGKLALARSICRNQKEKYPETAHAILQQSWELAPTREEQAHLLYELATLQNEVARRTKNNATAQTALANAELIYERYPRTCAASQARPLAISLHVRLSGPDKALAVVRLLQERGVSQRPGLDLAFFQIISAYSEHGNFEMCERILLELIENYAGQLPASQAMLRLARFYRDHDDETRQLQWLRRCAATRRPAHLPRAMEDIEDFRAEAVKELALWHENHDEWFSAFSCWKHWTPHSWCGNGLQGLYHERNARMQHCAWMFLTVYWPHFLVLSGVAHLIGFLTLHAARRVRGTTSTR